MALVTKNWLPTGIGRFVTVVHKLFVGRLDFLWSRNPSALVGHESSTFVPARVILRTGAFGLSLTVTAAKALLLVKFASNSLAATLTELVKVPEDWGAAITVAVAVALLAKLPKLKMMMPLLKVAVPWLDSVAIK